VTGSIWFYLFPLYILAGLLLILGVFALLGRIQGGRFLKPILTTLMKLPLIGRLMKRASQAALERQNPELASAIRKLEPHQKHLHDPQRAQKAMSQLTREERAALIEMQEQQGVAEPEAINRQMRRRLEKQKKQGRR
jgi:CMP-2-keto-3-deoxyoctulosonic acid synthetase